MGKLNKAQDRAMELIDEIGDGLRRKVPERAVQWVETGAAIGALKTGAKVATKFARRNPVLATAMVVGAGALWLAARHQAKKRATGHIVDGQAVRIGSRYVPPVSDEEMGV